MFTSSFAPHRLVLTAVLISVSSLASAASPPPAMAAPAPASPVVTPDYRIRAGDTLTVSVFNEPALSQPAVRVVTGGTITEPLAGVVRVGGLTPSQAGDAIAQALHKYVKHPQVAVAVALVGPMEVYVLGNVKTPGKYELQPDGRLMDALAAAGGLGPTDGALPDAVISDGNEKSTVSLQDLLHNGDLTLDRRLNNEETVYVPSPITFTVEVNGAVDHPGDIVMHEGDRLANAIARAGSSPNATSDLNDVVVHHTLPDGTVQTTHVNMYPILKDGDESKDVLLAKGDQVFVPMGKKPGQGSPLTDIFYALTRFI